MSPHTLPSPRMTTTGDKPSAGSVVMDLGHPPRPRRCIPPQVTGDLAPPSPIRAPQAPPPIDGTDKGGGESREGCTATVRVQGNEQRDATRAQTYVFTDRDTQTLTTSLSLLQ